MKRLVFGLLTMGSILMALPALAAGPYVTVDQLGHKRTLSEGGGVVYPSQGGDHFTFTPFDADIELQLQGQGVNNGSGNEEKALLGLTPLVFVGRTTALGIAVAHPDLANPDWLRISPTFKQYIAIGPQDSWVKFLKFQPFSYNFATGSGAGFTGGAFSIDMRLTGGAEFPLGGNVAFQLEAGIVAIFTELSQNVTNTVDPMLGGTFVYRIRPQPRG